MASICPFESENVERKGKNYKKLNISRTIRAFFDEIFIYFEGLSFCERIKI